MPQLPGEDALGTVAPKVGNVAPQASNPIPDAVAGLGNTISDAALQDQQIQIRLAKKQQSQDDAAQLAKARGDFAVANITEQGKYTLDQVPKYQGWGESYQNNMQPTAQTIADRIKSPRIRQQFLDGAQVDIAQGHQSLTDNARKIDTDTTKASALAGLDARLAAAAAPGVSKQQSDTIVAQTRTDIDNLTHAGIIAPGDAINIRQKWAQNFAALKVQQDIIADPTGTAGHLSGAGGDLYFQKLKQQESGGVINASNPNSSAQGQYQFTTGTWASVAKAHPELSLTPQGINNPDQQDRAIRAFTADNAKVLQGAGLPASEANLYLTHFMGAGDGVKMIQADSAANAADMFPKAAKANPSIFFSPDGHPRTVGQVRDIQTKGFSPSGGVAPDYYTMLSPDDRLRLQTQATASAEQAHQAATASDALTRFTMGQKIDNETAQITQTGQFDPTLNQQAVTQALGPEGAAKWLQGRKEATGVYAATNAIDSAPTPQLQGIVANLKPAAGDADFDSKQRLYDSAKTYAAQAQDMREKDPAGYVMAKVPVVNKAWQGFDPTNPTTASAAIKATVDAQTKLGIPPEKIQPLPATAADAVASRVMDTSLPVDDRIKTLVGMVTQTNDVGQQQAIMEQLGKTKLSEKVATVVSAVQRGDTAAARRLFTAATLDPASMPKQAANEVNLDKDVQTQLLGPGSFGEAYYGIEMGDPKNAHAAGSDMELVTNAARIAMAAGMPQQQAITQSINDVFGKVQRVDKSLSAGGSVKGLVDQGTDVTALREGLSDAMTKTVVPALNSYIERTMSKDDTPGAATVSKAILQVAATNLMHNGVWRNYGTGWGFYDPVHNGFVTGDDGKPIILNSKDLIPSGQAIKHTRDSKTAIDPYALDPAITGGYNPDTVNE